MKTLLILALAVGLYADQCDDTVPEIMTSVSDYKYAKFKQDKLAMIDTGSRALIALDSCAKNCNKPIHAPLQDVCISQFYRLADDIKRNIK